MRIQSVFGQTETAHRLDVNGGALYGEAELMIIIIIIINDNDD